VKPPIRGSPPGFPSCPFRRQWASHFEGKKSFLLTSELNSFFSLNSPRCLMMFFCDCGSFCVQIVPPQNQPLFSLSLEIASLPLRLFSLSEQVSADSLFPLNSKRPRSFPNPKMHGTKSFFVQTVGRLKVVNLEPLHFFLPCRLLQSTNQPHHLRRRVTYSRCHQDVISCRSLPGTAKAKVLAFLSQSP